jgi:hypothetical protein
VVIRVDHSSGVYLLRSTAAMKGSSR